MTTSLSKEDYLKRYLSPQESNDKPKKKRKKKNEVAKKVKGFKIVDDDVSWDTFTPKPDEFDEVNDKLLAVDEKPLIETIDVRTEEEQKMDEYRKSKMWKTFNSEDSIEYKKKRHNDLEVRRSKKSKRKKHSSSDSDFDNVPRESFQELDDIRVKKSNVKYSDSDSDLDVARAVQKHSRKTYDSDSDLDLIPRKSKTKLKRDSGSDMDIPRSKSLQKRQYPDSGLDVQRTRSNDKSKMEGGGGGGLTSVDLLRLEMKKLEKKESAMKVMAEEYKSAATVYRERGSGKKRDLAKEKQESEEDNLRKKRKEEQYAKWGRGLKQAEIRADAIADTIHESNKSLTRYNDDEDLEAMRKAAIRDGDPMAEYITKKKRKDQGSTDERPKYKGPAPAPNRFNMMPGYRWDGVDRSNGFEKRFFQSQSDNQALKDEFYKWNVSDM